MMDIHTQRSRWKIYLALAGISILLISLFYTSYLAQRLREGERNKALLLFDAYKTFQTADLDADLTLELNIFESNKDIPIMVASEADEVLYARNFGPDLDTNMVLLRERLLKLKKKGQDIFSNVTFGCEYPSSQCLLRYTRTRSCAFFLTSA